MWPFDAGKNRGGVGIEVCELLAPFPAPDPNQAPVARETQSKAQQQSAEVILPIRTHAFVLAVREAVLDITAMKAGIRRQLWHGFWMTHRPCKTIAEFERRQVQMRAAVRRQLTGFRHLRCKYRHA